MDLVLVLEVLRPGEDWGPCAQSDSTYERLAATWRSPLSECPTEAEMLATWQQIRAERPELTNPVIAEQKEAKRFLTSDNPTARAIRALLRLTKPANQTVVQWRNAFLDMIDANA